MLNFLISKIFGDKGSIINFKGALSLLEKIEKEPFFFNTLLDKKRSLKRAVCLLRIGRVRREFNIIIIDNMFSFFIVEDDVDSETNLFISQYKKLIDLYIIHNYDCELPSEILKLSVVDNPYVFKLETQ